MNENIACTRGRMFTHPISEALLLYAVVLPVGLEHDGHRF